ncbi:MAG: protein phosphatase 2C domain-containing protein [Acetobacteraceae bacterium]|nr:serine/threonine-protein phosphatase [Pseudomonadota bacterium]
MSRPHVVSWATTHPGAKRTVNQDAFVDRPDLGVWAVADGAGGHQGGEIASGMLRQALNSLPAGADDSELVAHVRAAVLTTHNALRRLAESRGPTVMMASTVVALVVRDTQYACLWAGDSRAYLLRNGRMHQITHDHSVVQELLDSGAITAAEADRHPHGNIITRAVGADDTLVLDDVSDRLRNGDRFLLCSDGLFKALEEKDILALLRAGAQAAPTQAMIDAALVQQASDNVTAVAIEVTGVADAEC